MPKIISLNGRKEFEEARWRDVVDIVILKHRCAGISYPPTTQDDIIVALSSAWFCDRKRFEERALDIMADILFRRQYRTPNA